MGLHNNVKFDNLCMALEGETFTFSSIGEINFNEISNPKPKDIIFHNPATIVKWSDGTKTVVKCHEEDTYDKEKGLALCYVKKFCGDNTSRGLNDILKLAGE